jgi:ABC-2 type transport system permease protein
MRHLVFSHLSVPPVVTAAINSHLAPSITWAGWPVPLWVSLGIVAVMGLGMMSVAMWEFNKTE